jgi:hypothetical protein
MTVRRAIAARAAVASQNLAAINAACHAVVEAAVTPLMRAEESEEDLRQRAAFSRRRGEG